MPASRVRVAPVEGAAQLFPGPEGDLPFFMHRERGLHLFEPEVTIDGAPVSAAILGTALTLFYAGRAQAERGQGVYFYLPKLETAEEARWYRDLFDASLERLPALRRVPVRGIVLVESLPCVYLNLCTRCHGRGRQRFVPTTAPRERIAVWHPPHCRISFGFRPKSGQS